MNRIVLSLILLCSVSVLLCGQTKHVVQRGETPESISRKYNVPLETLIDANPRLKDYCYVTMELTIPATVNSQGTSAGERSYVSEPNGSALNDYAQALDYGKQGNIEFERGNYSTAAKLYSKSIKLNPSAWEYHFNRGASYYNNNNYKKAIEDFNWVLSAVDDESIKQAARENIKNARDIIDATKAQRRETWANVGLAFLSAAAVVGTGVAIAAASQQPNPYATTSGYSYQPAYPYGNVSSDWSTNYTAAVMRQAEASTNRAMFEMQQLNDKMMKEAKESMASLDEVMSIHMEWMNKIWPEDSQNGNTLEQSFQSFFMKKYGRMPTYDQMQYCLQLIPPPPGSENDNSFDFDDVSSTSVASTGNYQEDYDRLARLVEGEFGSVSAMGYKYTNDEGETKYGMDANTSNSASLRMFTLIRNNQKEMQKIREEAARKGIRISQSPWETKTYSYY